MKEKAEDFVRNWESKLENVKSEGGEKQLCQTLWNDLAELFTGSREGLEFEKETANRGFADVYSKKYGFIAEQKSKGVDLDKPEERQKLQVTPFEQAKRYDDNLPAGEKVKTVITSNFERFRFYDLNIEAGIRGEITAECALKEIPEKLELFVRLFNGEPPREEYSILDAPKTELAAEKISQLYSLFSDEDQSFPLGEEEKEVYRRQIPLIIMRLVFLLFSDNTSADRGKIFKSGEFKTFLEKSTDDVHFTHDLLDLFKCLDIPETDRGARFKLMPAVRHFPYVDGSLFKEEVDFPHFPDGSLEKLRNLLHDFKYWDRIDVSVFGPIMDHVFAGGYRRENGIYYTSKENIEKVIEPLFMDELEHELEEIRKIKDAEKQQIDLKTFHEKLSRLQFFDPACGSGNFLTQTYRDLRKLEDEVIGLENSTTHDLDKEIKVSLSQFHGIEINPYAVTVARTALQIAREEALELSYKKFEDTVSAPPHFLPLKDEARGVVCGNALTMDWSDVVTPSEDLYIFGNPPFAGDYNKGAEQQKELDSIFAPYPAGKLDYCAAWYMKSAKFLNGTGAKFAFVSTNSITQGVQVEGLFKPVFGLGWKISFAWPSFLWDHRKDAVVTVVIIGFTQNENEAPKLYSLTEGEEPDWGKGTGFVVTEVENISPNNLEALPTAFVGKKASPISELPDCLKGNEPDSKALILKDEAEYEEAGQDPIAAKYVRKYLGAEELIYGKNRWCLWLVDSTPEERRKSKFLRERIEATKKARGDNKSAQTPWLFASIHQPNCSYLAIPAQFSEKRDYFTAAFLSKDVIASNTLYVASDPDCFIFSIIETSMFMAWQDLVGGRLETRRRFSNTLVWNTFPLSRLSKEQKDLIIEGGRKVLEARASHPGSSLADLYDPANMPEDLRKAHQALDKAMDSVFSDKPFRSEEERQRALLEGYEKITEEKGN
ncbi:MAG: class I SAM-dependent DNA methyltransferase [Aeriscardovia sp.]|nr:class I SAM-dependent DNA methyltransferase [Aeriscardovia sp.]